MLYFEQAKAEAWLAAVDGTRAVVVDLADRASEIPQLWLSLHSESGVRGVLDHLTANGLSNAPGFILLEWSGDWISGAAVRAIVRGDATVTLETETGPVSISGAAVSTWTEQHIEGVSSFALSVGDEAGHGGIALPLAVGAVWTSRLSSSFFEVETHSVPAAASRPRRAAASAPVIAALTPPVAEPTPPVASFSEQTILDLFGDDNSAAAVPPAFDAVDDATIVGRSPLPLSVPTPKQAPVISAAPAGDHDGHTVMSGDLRKMRAARAGEVQEEPQGAPPAPLVVHVQPRPTLHLPSGEIVALEQPVLIGRAPSVSKVSGGAMPRLVSLGGVDQDISRNHVQVTVEGDTVVVTDLHSRNGTLIVLPGKSPQKLRSGEPTAVIVGTLIDLGSGIGITVGEQE